MCEILRNNGLSLALFALFLASIVGQVLAGWYAWAKSWRSMAARRLIFAPT
jgi:hypothetical protein